jgi:hypothetical protein
MQPGIYLDTIQQAVENRGLESCIETKGSIRLMVQERYRNSHNANREVLFGMGEGKFGCLALGMTVGGVHTSVYNNVSEPAIP